jgi:hypothetical protein
MIAPLSEADIDIFVGLSAEDYQPDGQASLLDRVKHVLQRTYPKTPDISRNGQAVTIPFTDVKVDVVPAFYRKGGGYLISDSDLKRWIATDPKKHVEIWTAANRAHESNLVPLIKILKGWNKQHRALLRSFHLEVLILQILNKVTISNFPSGVRYVLDKALAQMIAGAYDPAGYGANVGAYLNTPAKLNAVLSRLQSAYHRAIDAERLATVGSVQQAYEKWRLVFGDYFPALG